MHPSRGRPQPEWGRRVDQAGGRVDQQTQPDRGNNLREGEFGASCWHEPDCSWQEAPNAPQPQWERSLGRLIVPPGFACGNYSHEEPFKSWEEACIKGRLVECTMRAGCKGTQRCGGSWGVHEGHSQLERVGKGWLLKRATAS